jgi:hypothetical protein
MHGGDYMVPGDCIISQDNSVYLSFQGTDGNVVLYNHSNNAVIWSSYKTGGTEFIQQGDGNLVEYNGSTALWASNVNSSCPATGTYLTLVYLDMNQYSATGTKAWDAVAGYTSPLPCAYNYPVSSSYGLSGYGYQYIDTSNNYHSMMQIVGTLSTQEGLMSQFCGTHQSECAQNEHIPQTPNEVQYNGSYYGSATNNGPAGCVYCYFNYPSYTAIDGVDTGVPVFPTTLGTDIFCDIENEIILSLAPWYQVAKTELMTETVESPATLPFGIVATYCPVQAWCTSGPISMHINSTQASDDPACTTGDVWLAAAYCTYQEGSCPGTQCGIYSWVCPNTSAWSSFEYNGAPKAACQY